MSALLSRDDEVKRVIRGLRLREGEKLLKSQNREIHKFGLNNIVLIIEHNHKSIHIMTLFCTNDLQHNYS